ILALAFIGFGFAHPLAQGLVVDPEVAGYVGDRSAGVGDHPGAAIEQLIGVFLLSWHGLGVPFFQVGILVSGSPSNLAWLTTRQEEVTALVSEMLDEGAGSEDQST